MPWFSRGNLERENNLEDCFSTQQCEHIGGAMQTYMDKPSSSSWVFQRKRGCRDRFRGRKTMQTASPHAQPWLLPMCPLPHIPHSVNFQSFMLRWEINCLGPGGITKASSTKDLCISVQRCISFPTARGSHLDLADVILFVQAERSL